jgi:hypothetical protein
VATDRAGNREAAPAVPQAQTTVTLSNRPPVLAAISNQTINAGETLSLTASATDADGDAITYAVGAGAPLGMVLNAQSGALSWITSPGQGGSTNAIAVIARDNGFPSLSVTQTFLVAVQVPNHAPVAASPFTIGVKLGVPATVRIIGGKHPPTDADNDALTLTSVTGATNGIVSTDGSNVTYTATSGSTDSFLCAISDGHGGTANQTVNVTITSSSGTGYNQLSAQSLGGGTNVLTFLGTPGFNYALESATNLVTPEWIPRTTNPAAVNGWLIFTNVTSQLPVFYRTRYVP